MGEDGFPQMSSLLDHFDVLTVTLDVEFVRIKALFQRLGDDLFGPF